MEVKKLGKLERYLLTVVAAIITQQKEGQIYPELMRRLEDMQKELLKGGN